MRKIVPIVFAVFFMCFSFAQNRFPTTPGSSAFLDGGNYLLRSPNTPSWARGDFYRHSGTNVNLAGVGVLANRNQVRHLFIGIGNTPWNTRNSINLRSNGNVGIGTTSPVVDVDIRGFSPNTRLVVGTGQNTGDSRTSIEFRHRYLSSVFPNGQILSAIRSQRVTSSRRSIMTFNTNSTNTDVNAIEQMRIHSNGHVGIGTRNPGDYRLAVNGSVRAKEVVVETGWSDFVFEKDYKLRSLDEVEDHIEKHGHLPEIPSAKEVAENGVKLGEMDSKLLMKIEELTLYLIAQQKEIDRLKKSLDKVQSQK